MNEIIIYQSDDRKTRVEVRFEQDTVWLTQQQMASLFEQTKQNMFAHQQLLQRGRVIPGSKRYRTRYYNLDVVISVGYRIKSRRGVQFRQWATSRLYESIYLFRSKTAFCRDS